MLYQVTRNLQEFCRLMGCQRDPQDLGRHIFNKLSKLPTKNSETLSQKSKVEEIFSSSHDMVDDVSSY